MIALDLEKTEGIIPKILYVYMYVCAYLHM